MAPFTMHEIVFFVILDFVCSNLFQINNFIKVEYVEYSHIYSYSVKWKDF